MSRRGVPVVVFAKPPVPGRTKARLARALGDEEAARLARAFLEDTWATVGALGWARPILASATADVAAFGLEGEVEVWPQGEGDLGERLERVLARGLEEAGAVLLVGGDVPGLPGAHLDAARGALARHDVVLGPAEDGGFYLIGAARLPAGALAGIRWSAADTLDRTEEALARAGLSLARAPAWLDVDEPEDLPRLVRVLADRPDAAPRTRRALRGG
jgi:hypothetical protein